MEELQKTLVTKIGEQLKVDKPNIQYLDVLNRLLGTASNWLLCQKDQYNTGLVGGSYCPQDFYYLKGRVQRMGNNQMIGKCKNCGQDYCQECSINKNWQEFCSDICEKEYKKDR